MLRKEQSLGPIHAGREHLELPLQQVLLKQLLPDPQRNGHAKRAEAGRRKTDVCLEQAFELEKRLVIKDDEVDVVEPDSGLCHAVLDRTTRKTRIVLLTAEAFLLSGGDDPAVFDERGRAIVIKRRQAKNPHLEDGINEGGDRRSLYQNE